MNERIQNEMKQCELYAMYWIAVATTGADSRLIYKGGLNGERMTPRELQEEALATALRHIQRRSELMEAPK